MSASLATVILPVIGLVILVPLWKIVSRLGYPGLVSLLFFVPLANIVFLYYLAFADWPRSNSM